MAKLPGGVKKRDNGTFEKRFCVNGKRYSVYAPTLKELATKELDKRREIEEGLTNLYNPTLKTYYKHFSDIRRRELKESTLRAQQIQFNNMASVKMAKGICFGDMKIQDITRRDIETAREILLKTKTPENLNIMFAHLNHVFECAVADETLTKNPCKALKPLKREKELVKETKHRALSEEETRTFFSVANEKNSYYLNAFKVLIKTGLRIGELTALTWKDIDTKKGFIHVHSTIARDENGAYYISEETKTSSGKRDIPLTEELKSILKQQRVFNYSLFGISDNMQLFRGAEGGILREYSINREIKRICKETNIEVFTCHSFRNTYATRFIEQRPQDYKILSEILGHKDISITLNLYTHVMAENKIKAMNEVNIKIS